MQSIKTNMILGRYQPIETAGEGGFAKVIHAYDTRLKREVAIKVVELENAPLQAESTERTTIPGLDEARAAGKLANANIVTIYDCEVSENKAYVIEEYVEGITLTTLLNKLEDEVDLDVIAHIFKSVSTALMAAHKENILHLDIKPDNILIGRGGDVKVADFGLATLMDLNGEASASAGTLGYMPPEHMNKEALDVRADEWSLAILTYEMLTGTNPFSGAKNISDAEKQMLTKELVVPSACWEGLDEAFDDVIFKALNVDKDSRFASVRQFSTELKPHLGDAREGKKKLAVLVNGSDEKLLETGTLTSLDSVNATESISSFVDRIGWHGLDLICKTVAAIAALVMVVYAAANIHYPAEQTSVFLQTQPVISVAVALASAAFVWLTPRFGILAPFVAIEAMFNLNSAWSTMAFYAIAFVMWWSYVGRSSDESSECFLFASLAGAFGFAPVAIAFVGATEKNVSDAACSAAGIFFQAFTFGVFGSHSVFSWDLIGNFSLGTTTASVTTNLGENFLSMFTDPCLWITCAFWIAAAVVFSFLCKRKTKALHVFGALMCGLILLMSAFVQWPIPMTIDEIQAVNAVGACVAAVCALILAATNFTKLVRMEAWEF